jgi:hypothetical protein
MSKLIGRTLAAAAAAVVALASTGFSGTALAWGGGEEGGNGTGGTATNNCLNVGIPILSGTGIAGQGIAVAAQCNATANGTGGDAD